MEARKELCLSLRGFYEPIPRVQEAKACGAQLYPCNWEVLVELYELGPVRNGLFNEHDGSVARRALLSWTREVFVRSPQDFGGRLVVPRVPHC